MTNGLLRSKLFDCAGNFCTGNLLYCYSCIRFCFGISGDWLAWQCNIKCQCLQDPIMDMTKADVIEEHVSNYLCLILSPHHSASGGHLLILKQLFALDSHWQTFEFSEDNG